MRKWVFHILVFLSPGVFAQDSIGTGIKSVIDSSYGLKKSRQWFVGAGSVLAYSSSFVLLNEAWYKGYPRSSFHTFDDSGEWQQMDKIGHAWSTYHISRLNTGLWRWTGMTGASPVLIGTGASLLYMLSIEYLDGRSAEWGWSWADAGADIFGAVLFAGQELTWKDQKINIKFSSHRKNYGTALEKRTNTLFGQSLPEQILKDYNAQTYWLSFNTKLLGKNLPPWLNIAVGYGADGMFGGYENRAREEDGNIVFDRSDIKRYRQWYLSPDIDLSKIGTNKRLLKTIFFLVNCIKIPAPALEWSNGKLKGHWLYF